MNDDTSSPVDKRVNESFLAGYERAALQAIAGRLPKWVTPDGLTGFGVFGAVLVLCGGALANQALSWLWLANLGIVIHWLGDSLDGTVARLRRIERPRYGFYLDQVIDTVGNLLIALGVGLCPGMRMELILILLAAYQMLAIQVLVRAMVDGEFHVAVGRMGPTELRLGIFAINLLTMALGTWAMPGLPHWLHWQDLVLGISIVGLLALFGWQMADHLGRLAREDPGQGSIRSSNNGMGLH